jgi:tRNA A-37 threonylcarbamoyl transferase component Bud32
MAKSPGVARWFVLASIIFAACSAGLGYFVHQSIRHRLCQNLQSELQTVLDADIAALRMWQQRWIAGVQTWAAQPRVRELCAELTRLEKEQDLTTSQLETTETHGQFLEAFGPVLSEPEIRGVALFTRDGHVIATNPVPHPGDIYVSPHGASNISRVFYGETVFLKPYMEGSNIVGELRPDKIPLTAVLAPVRVDGGKVVAALMFRMRIDQQLDKLFAVAQLGQTGETYAFDEQGTVLSSLRHDRPLRRIGVIPEDAAAALNVQLRDPGADLFSGGQPSIDLATRPITRVPALAIAGKEAVDSEGYRNYAGVIVVGASKWLAEFGCGVVTEIQREEAYAPLRSLTWIFGGVFGLFVSAAGLAGLFSLRNLMLRDQVSEARRLGQYALEELIGQGGMGKVYKASHTMLQRPTAIKLIEPHQADEQTISRFEREVRLASELTHPNTIQIYDYGRTDDGVFYYVMEFLPGVNLSDLVSFDGPLPVARAIYILRQLCGSLAEAHGKGLVHRDVKPANIMLCEQGGQYDFVKVLDFGLVKRVSALDDTQVTRSEELSGTPLYIAPERIREPSIVDPRSDLYSVGTVAFYLLTGQYVFEGGTPIDILHKVMNDEPRRPSEVAKQEVPAKLERLVLDCLAKDPDDRPADISVAIEMLDCLMSKLPWHQSDAKCWWEEHRGNLHSTVS